jgi:hypothetical protein
LVEKNRCAGLMRALLGPIDETRNCAGMRYPHRWNLQFEMNESRAALVAARKAAKSISIEPRK